jgi:hypothetical protein
VREPLIASREDRFGGESRDRRKRSGAMGGLKRSERVDGEGMGPGSSSERWNGGDTLKEGYDVSHPYRRSKYNINRSTIGTEYQEDRPSSSFENDFKSSERQTRNKDCEEALLSSFKQSLSQLQQEKLLKKTATSVSLSM